ncbi:hypothetical protein R2R35_19995 [Anaerocolumna sp. AGMB13020]|uniref:hypothetical protein n=1 Tax=Anaerocolumna sp. AGMB13020 TaxID=3081750 RepID=UPI002952C688|nr:hypothetical protein [Anaerocolumna sp. AGMB13020]WOO36055.1 hypothetical protein R2R35_19995 [Anaerocolumna sp. AGMB13020]
MIETTVKTLCKQLSFEKSGETLSVELKLINVSPDMKIEKFEELINRLFIDAKNEII